MLLASLHAILANGTTALPLANISTPFTVYENDSHVIHFLSNEVVSIFTADAHYYYHVEGNRQECYKQDPEPFPEFFPDLAGFQLVQENVRYKGQYVSVYRRMTNLDHSKGEFFSIYESEEMFYCIALNNGVCMPVSYQTHGRNPVLNSHTDVYIYEYNEVDLMPDDFVYRMPSECDVAVYKARPDLRKGPEERISLEGDEFPEELDWRVRGFGTPVKDQASCGSCWTFAVAGMLEGRINARRGLEKEKIRISEQQFLNCLWTYDQGDMDNQGCYGGFTLVSMNKMLEKYGGRLPLEEDEPYIGFEGRCNDSAWNSDILIEKAYQLEKTSEALKMALQDGPVAVSIAVPESMSFYTGGIYDDEACGYGADAQLTHAVVAIGYGKDDVKGDYWIIKNSWSNKWGVDGFLYLKDDNDLCGVLQRMVVADIKHGDSSSDIALIAGIIIALVVIGVVISAGLAFYFYKRHKSMRNIEQLISPEGDNYAE